MKVLFIWDVPDKLRQYFRTKLPPGFDLIFPKDTSEETLCALAKDVEMIIGWRPSERLLNSATRLKLFQNPGAGVQHLVPLFRHFPQIQLANCHGNAYFTAQHAVALLLALTNKVIPHHNFMHNGVWRTGDKEGKSTPLRNKTIGILGYGHVGRLAAQFLSGFDVDIVACKRNVPQDKFPHIKKIYSQEEFAAFLRITNVLIVTLPLTTATTDLIGKHELNLLGKEGLLVNMGRGPIIVQRDLYQALKDTNIAGAALDVWYNTTPEEGADGKRYPYDYPFHELANVVLSPHRGASPMDDLARWDDVIINAIRLKNGDQLLNLVKTGREY